MAQGRPSGAAPRSAGARLGPVDQRGPQTVHFHPDEPSAMRAVRWLDETGCGGKGCQPTSSTGLANHYLVRLAD